MTSKKEQRMIRLLTTSLDQIADAVFITNTKGKILYVNHTFEKMTGYSKKEALGNTPRIISSGQHEKNFYKKLWSTILKGKVFRKKVINKRKNGSLFYTDHTITPVKDDNGEVIHFIGSWKDITKEMKDEEKRLELINLLSHELKTPLTSVKSLTQLLHKRSIKKNNTEDIMFFSKMEIQVDRLIGFINDLLDVSNISSGKLRFKFVKKNFDNLVVSIVKENLLFYDSHKIKIIGKTSGEVMVDEHHIEQVIHNLIINAIKYSPKNKKITLALEKVNDDAVLKVIDSGIGISKKEQKKIFKKFYRASNKRNRSIPGVGLGLYLSSEIIKRHGGRIWVESQPEQGSTFSISLPILK